MKAQHLAFKVCSACLGRCYQIWKDDEYHFLNQSAGNQGEIKCTSMNGPEFRYLDPDIMLNSWRKGKFDEGT